MKWSHGSQSQQIAKAKRIIITAATIAWMLLIFYMSAQTGTSSSGMSDRICDVIGRIIVSGYDSKSAVWQAEFIASISFYIRKAAHMTEYAILGILWLLLLKTWGLKIRRAFFFSVMISILYAATDEAHQLLVAGRAGQIRDVAIDSVGVLIGTGILMLMLRLRNKP